MAAGAVVCSLVGTGGRVEDPPLEFVVASLRTHVLPFLLLLVLRVKFNSRAPRVGGSCAREL